MNHHQRVCCVIRHRRPDRVPLYGWVSANLSEPIAAAFGSVAAFEDHYDFDLAHLFGGPPTFAPQPLGQARAKSTEITPAVALALPLTDPDDPSAYDDIRAGIAHHKTQRGRFVYVQTPGIFEALNAVFGIENHLMYLALEPETLNAVYERQAAWNRAFAMNCLDLGVDMIHVSDDWGAQHSLLFSPDTWRRLIYPHHKSTVDAVKGRDAFVSLHSDGNINAVVDGIVELGYDVVHPWQESAGMSLADYQARWQGRFAVMGGLDVQTVIGFGRLDRLRSEIERVMGMFRQGGLIFCTTHFVQAHCTIDELVLAFDLARELAG